MRRQLRVPCWAMSEESLLSSSGVHCPLFTLSFSQHGIRPISLFFFFFQYVVNSYILKKCQFWERVRTRIMEGSLEYKNSLSSTTTCELSLPVFQFFEAKREDVEYFFGLVFVFFILLLSMFFLVVARYSLYIRDANGNCMGYIVKAQRHQRRMNFLMNSTPLSVWERQVAHPQDARSTSLFLSLCWLLYS